MGYEYASSDEFMGCSPCREGYYKDTQSDGSCTACGDDRDTHSYGSTDFSQCRKCLCLNLQVLHSSATSFPKLMHQSLL